MKVKVKDFRECLCQFILKIRTVTQALSIINQRRFIPRLVPVMKAVALPEFHAVGQEIDHGAAQQD
jgi:hypothetical protein